MRFVSNVIVLLLVIVTVSNCKADEPKDRPTEPQLAPDKTDDRQVSICPLFELMVMTGGTLYYCDLFDQDDCLDEPEASYLFGDYAYPCSCVNEPANCCQPARGKNHRFPGLLSAVPPGYVHLMPAGRARENSRVLSDPEVPFVKCTVDKRPISVKVFVLMLDIDGATGGIPTNTYQRAIYVGFESQENSSSAKPVTAKPLDSNENETHYVYSASYAPASGKPREILILTARKAAEISEAGPKRNSRD